MPEADHLRVCLLTDVFPPRSGGSGWSTFYLGKALAEAGHDVLVLRPIYGAGVARPGLRRSEFRGLTVEEVLVPEPPRWLQRAGPGKAWEQHRASRLLAKRAARLATGAGYDVLHGQHMVSGVAASRAAQVARRRGAKAVSLCIVRDYWPLCPSSTRLIDGHECPDCHRLMSYLRCDAGRGPKRLLRLPLAVARWLNTLLISRELAQCDAVVAVSRYVQGELARSRRVPEGILHTIPNLVDLPSVDAALDSPWPLHDISRTDCFLLFAGKLDENKGARLLPSLVAESGVKLPVVIAGDGPDRELIDAEARKRGLDFRFYDWLDNETVLRLMRSATALLFPSAWQEPLSRVLLEGCATGAAIVALNRGGTPDVIEHEVSGWLASNEHEFAEGLRAIVEQPELNARLRQGARQHAETTFAAPTVCAQVVALYGQLLSEVEAAS